MKAFNEPKMSEVSQAISSFSAQSDNDCTESDPKNRNTSNHARGARALNPYADLRFQDGRRFRVTELRAFDAHERNRGYAELDDTFEVGTQSDAPRWQVEMEVQSDGRGDNFVFQVFITWGALRRGELERVGYNSRCDRPTAIFLLARERVWQHLQNHAFPARLSSYQWPVRLKIE